MCPLGFLMVPRVALLAALLAKVTATTFARPRKPRNWPAFPQASARVGEEGFEPSHPFGHTDLNRARLPFRHPPGRGLRLARPQVHSYPGYHRVRRTEGRPHEWEFCSASNDGWRAWSRVRSRVPSSPN